MTLMFKSVELFSGGLSLRQSEELLIESNILLKDTDMDIRMGRPVNPCCVWDWRTHFIMDKVAPDIHGLDHIFKLRTDAKNWKERLLEHYFIKNAQFQIASLSNVNAISSELVITLISVDRMESISPVNHSSPRSVLARSDLFKLLRSC